MFQIRELTIEKITRSFTVFVPLEKSHDKVSREAPWYCIGTSGVAEGRNSIEKAWELIRIDKNLAIHGIEITD